jgi:hypothetical protein
MSEHKNQHPEASAIQSATLVFKQLPITTPDKQNWLMDLDVDISASPRVIAISSAGTAPPIPPSSGFPAIPATAKNYNLDQATNWKGEHDTGTGASGIITGVSTSYDATNKLRNFQATQQNHAGVRFHNSFGNNLQANNYVYALDIAGNWGTIGQLELDMNQVTPDGRTVLLCTQANNNSGGFDYTTTPGGGGTKWNPSNIKICPKQWADGSWHTIRIKTSHDGKGNVLYEAVEVDGTNHPFTTPSAPVLSARALGWTPLGLLLMNLQFNGAQSSGTMKVQARNIIMTEWAA